MKTLLPLLIVPVIAGIGFPLHAQEPVNPRTTGTVLLLKTGHAMEGEITKEGTQLCVRRGKSEVWIAEDLTIRLCADWDDAFAFAVTQIRPDDANDRIRLARWCHMNHLTEKALAQARLALEQQPNNIEAKQLVVLFERAMKAPPPKSAPPAPVVAARPVEPAPMVDVSFETRVAFTTKVQPILMNVCASCHATDGGGGKFHLERVGDGSQKGATHRNLAAVLAFVDLERPAISPILVRAVTPHGGAANPAIRDRSAKPLQSMQEWIVQAVAKNPHLKEYAAKKQPKGTPVAEPKSVFSSQQSAAPPQAEETEAPPRVARTRPDERDWCDPDYFNEHFHPELFRQMTASRP